MHEVAGREGEAGERCELNALGRDVEKYWRELPTKYPELELFDFVVMPNHHGKKMPEAEV